MANVLHGSANAIGGQNAVIKLRWGATADELLFDGRRPGVKFALGENPKQSNWRTDNPRYPQTRMGVEQAIVEAFEGALDYRRELERAAAAHDPSAVPPRRDLRKEALLEILDGKRHVHAHAYRADEMLMLLGLSDRYGFDIAAFQHGLEAYKIADEIAAHGVGVSTFSDWWAYKYEVVDAIPYNGPILLDHGVVTSYNSDDDELARRLNTEAAKAVRYGNVSEEQALGLVTIGPATQLGIDGRVGSLEKGKDADFVVWNGNPLSPYSLAEQTWIDGRRYFDRDEDLARRQELTAERDELLAEAEAAHSGAAEAGSEEADDQATAATEDAAPMDSTTHAPALPAPAAEPAAPTRPAATPAETAAPTGPAVAFVGGTVHPVSSPPIEDATLVLRGDRIVAVGHDVTVPDDARVIDATGKHLYPGFIHPKTTLGLVEVDSVRGTDDTREIGQVNSNLRAEVAFNGDSFRLPPTVAGGVTSALIVPEGGVFTGTSAVMRLAGWNWRDMTVRAPVGMHLQWPHTTARPWDDEKKLEEQRKKDLELIDTTVAAARAYAKARHASAAGEAPKPPFDPRLDALVPVVEGALPLFIHAETESEIESALDWADENGFGNLVLVASYDVAKIADRVAAAGIPVILDTIHRVPLRAWEPYDAPFTAAARLYQAGVRFAIAAGGGDAGGYNARDLPFEAGTAVAFGLPKDEALAAITLHAAQILGVDDRLGSLEPGKEATLLVTDGDPLEIRTHIDAVWIDGRETDRSDDRQWRLDQKYARRSESDTVPAETP